jgi:tetratricopeptide (TPR) repeat protein
MRLRETATARVTALLLLSLVSVARGASTDLQLAEEQYEQTNYGAALTILLPLSIKNAAVHALIGKAYYMEGQFKNSTLYLEKAVSGDPLNSSYYDWLGKAYGRRAEQSSFLTALPYANKTRNSFEKAVALDPANSEALGDLFEYYLEAPGIVGGGIEKAEGVAARIGSLNEAEHHYALARLAEKRKDAQRAEQEYRAAIQLAPGDIGRVIDLANFLSKQKRYEDSEQQFDLAGQMTPNSPKLMFARATAYVQSGRNLSQAKALLSQYAGSRLTPDDPPRSEAAKLLNTPR